MNPDRSGSAADDCTTPRLNAWANACRTALSESRSLFKPYFAASARQDDAGLVLARLEVSCVTTSDGALVLVTGGRLWPADMLARSVFEGTLRFVWLCARDPAERALRAREYAKDLTELGRLRRHERAQKALALMRDADAGLRRPYEDLVMADHETAEIRARYPRAVRQTLEHRWAASSLVQALATTDLPGASLLPSMLHSYGMASHMIHQDWTAVEMLFEREEREPDDRDAVTLAHGARVCSDMLHFALFRLFAAYHHAELDPAPIIAAAARYRNLVVEWQDAYVSFHAAEYGSPSTR